MTHITISLDDHLMSEVQKLAARTGRTMTAVIEESLRQTVGHVPRPENRQPFAPLPTFKGGGLQPGVNIDDGAALRDLMDENVPLDQLR